MGVFMICFDGCYGSLLVSFVVAMNVCNYHYGIFGCCYGIVIVTLRGELWLLRPLLCFSYLWVQFS